MGSDVKELGTILALCAHPDDETFCYGGTLAAATANGQTVICVTATRGEGGVQDPAKWPPTTLGKTREDELQAALKVLGVQEHFWLDYSDGSCNTVQDETAAQKILALVHHYRPDTILTFGSDGLTGHPDHQTVSRWADLVAKQLDKKPAIYHVVTIDDLYEKYLRQADERLNMYFNIDQPVLKRPTECDFVLELTPELQRTKCRALWVMPSQTANMKAAFDEDFWCKAFSVEAFVRA